MLVVLALMALVSTVIALNATPSADEALQRQALRLGELMALASDRARLAQQPVTWEADLGGYRFVVDDDGERRSLDDDLLRERRWERPLQRLTITTLPDGVPRTLLAADAPPLQVPLAREWVQPRWRLELAEGAVVATVEFDAAAHGRLVAH